MLQTLRDLTPKQRGTVLASYLGWTLDAFDFFILVFVMEDIAKEFGANITDVTFAIFLTLAARPLGALLFGLAADRFGRRPVLMVNILAYSLLGFASGFAPSLAALLVIRALFGVAMGGEWGVGASLTMESIPPRTRGAVSGLLQTGYPSGYLIASIVYFALYGVIGWRGMFMVGALPALLVVYIRAKVDESPAFLARTSVRHEPSLMRTLRDNAGRFLYVVVLMTAFNFFSHGTQDLYPTFLRQQHHFDPHTVGLIAIVYNIGAILGGITFGTLSERIGRRRGIVIAALGALLIIPLWAYGTSPVTLATGAFLMQFAVQGAWGIVPVHLNELSPHEIRGTFPGFAYQTGNLLASANATIQASVAHANGGNYAFALALVAAIVAVVLAALTALGIEARGVKFPGGPDNPMDA
ncbi:MFS transporter [Methylocapsa sp. D3K7]|uniref:MFS transporter n=1 Tax=Methylocapsa sp. D3K7 TaxID=3041435 RepID=UPI00244E8E85|nr:MFS transporter [Methylocapsa sp. D3K7]WGJ14093.1 MFS transporter [Methylocapsa sp. D3K7]